MRIAQPLVLIFAIFASAAIAQSFSPEKVTFSGSDLSQTELLAFTGLHPGDAVTREQMQAVSDKLTASGLFAGVRFSFDGGELTFLLQPSTTLLPVRYGNFPWWDERALNAAVAAKVPLFHGSLDPSGAMRDQVSAALRSLLAAKGIQAVITTGAAADANSDQAAVLYRIDSPPVVVGPVHIEGYSGVWTQPLDAIEKSVEGQPFDGSSCDKLAALTRAAYGRLGYLGMTMTTPVAGQPRLIGGKVLVPIRFSITAEGGQYRVAGLHLNGDSFMTEAQFLARAPLHQGDVANQELLQQAEDAVLPPYRAHGYLHAKINVDSKLDATNRTVNTTIAVDSGAVYYMGKLRIVNLTDQQEAEILPYWPLHEGDVYNPEPIARFLDDYRKSRAPLLQTIHNLQVSLKASEDEETHSVDLVLTFPPQA